MGVKRDRDEAGMSNNAETITEDEAALYDRQIRLWGMDCQRRLREAKILIIGLNGLGVEVVKNLTLCGVKSITLMDEKHVTESDCSAQFYAVGHIGEGRASASKSSIQELNPRVQVVVDPADPASLAPDYYAGFSAVFATDRPASQLVEMSKICHDLKVHFYCGDTMGFYGWGFLDLLTHKFSKLGPKNGKGEQTTTFQTFEYCHLGNAMQAKVGAGLRKKVNKVYPLVHILNQFHQKKGRFPSPANRTQDLGTLREVRDLVLSNLAITEAEKVDEEMLCCVFGELSPVCASVGGIMADQIIKGISCQGTPIHNFLLFDGDSCVGATETIAVKD